MLKERTFAGRKEMMMCPRIINKINPNRKRTASQRSEGRWFDLLRCSDTD
jgi:hypothetical protein